MPPYDDRYSSNTRLYVGHLSSRTRTRDLEHIFSRYGRFLVVNVGRVRNVDMKRDYAFIDFSDPRDADDARHYLDGRDVDGRRITVEFARGTPRGPGGVREYGGRGPVPGTGRCFNCGIDGHWARDCRAGDWKNKCYRCGERGHIERNCQNSPKKLSSRSGRSYSRSPVRSSSPRRGRSRERSFSRGRSYSRSRSPARRERNVRSPDRKSPELRRTPSPSKARRRGNPAPNNDSPRKQLSPIEDLRPADYSNSPKERNRLPSPSRKDTRSGGPRHKEEGAYSDSPKEDYKQSPDPIDEDRGGSEQEAKEDNRKSPNHVDGDGDGDGDVSEQEAEEDNGQTPDHVDRDGYGSEQETKEDYKRSPDHIDEDGGGSEQEPKEDYKRSPDPIDEDGGGSELEPMEDYKRSPDPIDEDRGGLEQELEYRQQRGPSPIKYTTEQEQDLEEGYIDNPKESSQSPLGETMRSKSPRDEIMSPANVADDDDENAGGGLPPSPGGE